MNLALPFPAADDAFNFIKSNSISKSFCLLNSCEWVERAVCVSFFNIHYKNYFIISIAIVFPNNPVLKTFWKYIIPLGFVLLSCCCCGKSPRTL